MVNEVAEGTLGLAALWSHLLDAERLAGQLDA
jgi:hypothetical protein